MKTLAIAVLGAALTFPMGVSAMSFPAGVVAPQEETQTTIGSIKSVNKEAKSFVVTSSDKKDTTVRTDDKTIYMLDGKVAKMEDVVKVGNDVTVTHKGGLASKVESKSKTPH